MENIVKLRSQDGHVLEVQKEVAIKSHTISNFIGNTGHEIEIPLLVKFNTLIKVMQYCEMHKDDNPPEIQKPIRSTNMAEIVDQKDADFIDIENLEELFELIEAANYLCIQSLLELSCAKVTTFIQGILIIQINKKQGKTPEEIRKKFNIQDEKQETGEENK